MKTFLDMINTFASIFVLIPYYCNVTVQAYFTMVNLIRTVFYQNFNKRDLNLNYDKKLTSFNVLMPSMQ